MRTGRPSKFQGFDCEDFQNYLKKNSIIDKNGCWIWQGATTKNGYGKIKVYQVTQSTHRLSFKVFKNFLIKTEDFVCHSCDVKLCINPDHLFLGDNRINQEDSYEKKGILRPFDVRLNARKWRKNTEFKPLNLKLKF